MPAPATTVPASAAAARAPRELAALVRPAVRAERAYRVTTELDVPAKLDQNESPFGLPQPVLEVLLDALRRGEWQRYPSDRPHRLVARLADELGWPAEGIIVGRGSNELIHSLGLCLVPPARRVVLPRPMFALFESVVRMHGGEVVAVAPEPDLSHSAEAVIRALRRSGAPLAIVCSPNNPTGHAFSFAELTALADAAPGLLVIDEAYVEFAEAETAVDLARERPQVMVLRTMSKAMGLAGLRVGYLLGHPVVIAEMEKARLPFLVDRLSEAAAIALLDHREVIRARVALISAERERVVGALRARGDVEILPSRANFFLLRSALAPAALQAALLREGVRVRSMAAYPELAGGPWVSGRFDTGWVRVSVGTPGENSDFLAALERVLR